MAERETGKRRAKRIPTDYFKKPDAIHRWKLRLTGLALILALVWWGTGLDLSRGGASGEVGDLRASHGTLASVHSAWDSKCEACHAPFNPINGKASWLKPVVADSSASDKLCQNCHKGTTHHVAQIESEVKSCAGCHHDHNGREFDLTRVSDSDCTSCHANLDGHTDTAKKPKGTKVYEPKITRFDLNHPDFFPASYAEKSDKGIKDKSKITFGHKNHLIAGQPGKDQEAGAKSLDKIPAGPMRERYRAITTRALGRDKPVADTELVKLDCAACHALDSGDLMAAGAVSPDALPQRADGAYMIKISYENQCAACHENKFDTKDASLVVAHGQQPDEVVKYVRGVYAEQILGQNGKLFDSFQPKGALPGKSPEEESLRKKFDESVAKAEEILFQGKTSCKECHEKGFSQEMLHGSVPKSIARPNIPEVWFGHAVFKHSAHQAVSCKDCHKDTEGSKESSDYLLPDVKNCQQCHRPGPTSINWLKLSDSSRGEVAFNCTECHRYHNGDNPLAGIGSKNNDGTSEFSVESFLKGSASAGGSPAPAAAPTVGGGK